MKSALYTAILVLASSSPVLAGLETSPIQIPVPEPASIALLSASAAAVTLGVRWFRRK